MKAGQIVKLGFVLIGILSVLASFAVGNSLLGLLFLGIPIIISLVLAMFSGNVKVTIDKKQDIPSMPNIQMPQQRVYQRPLPMPQMPIANEETDDMTEDEYEQYKQEMDAPPVAPQGYIPTTRYTPQYAQQTIQQKQYRQKPILPPVQVSADPYQDLEREAEEAPEQEEQEQSSQMTPEQIAEFFKQQKAKVKKPEPPQPVSKQQLPPTGKIICSVCQKEFRNMAEYKRHYALKHAVIPAPRG